MSECPDDFEFESFSSSNYSNFAIECNWNSKISHIHTNCGFGSFEKNCFFFVKFFKDCKFAAECVSNDNISVKYLFTEIRKLENLIKNIIIGKKKRFHPFERHH